MKTCPNCGELLGPHADSCFNCRYDYALDRVVSGEEWDKKRERIDEQIRNQEQERREQEENPREYERKQRLKDELIRKEKMDFIRKLPLYEYATEIIIDKRSGGVDAEALVDTLAKYARDGWRLHTAFTNEAGKNVSSIGYGGVSVGINTTIDQTILIFERMISKGSL